MWSNYYWYFQIRGNSNFSVRIPTTKVISILESKKYLQRDGVQSFKNIGSLPWIQICCVFTEDGSFGRPESLENEWCTMIDILGSKNFPDSLEYYSKVLSDIADDLDWELVLECDDDENENVVLRAIST